MTRRSHPLGLGTEEDIADAALYLASDESKYVTGAPLIIDGGSMAIIGSLLIWFKKEPLKSGI